MENNNISALATLQSIYANYIENKPLAKGFNITIGEDFFNKYKDDLLSKNILIAEGGKNLYGTSLDLSICEALNNTNIIMVGVDAIIFKLQN